MLTFIIGLMAGGAIGVFVMCLLITAGRSDYYLDVEDRGHVEDTQWTKAGEANTEVNPDDPL